VLTCIFCIVPSFLFDVQVLGNSLDKLCHTRSVAYSVKLLLLNKHKISGGGAYPDCYQVLAPYFCSPLLTLTLLLPIDVLHSSYVHLYKRALHVRPIALTTECKVRII